MQALREDPEIAALVERHGPLELEPAADPFERLVVSIVNQQISTASAAAIRERLFDRFEIAPETLLRADEDDLAAVGLSAQKVEYVQNVARAFVEGDLTRETFVEMTDEEVVAELTEIRGVGTWTAKMFLMFALGREDVFPVEDLGVRNGMRHLFGDELTREEMVDRAEAWRPHRSVACLYLWRAYDGGGIG
ncbi:DNA-3-methyladenine glycosylase family protein [Halegenticoccus tardaugens]|uniref:DNA-3-methyladenine glycosylase family protein n=1 Tax=Halegenticoccus tardaugens TaxID=2071624 RepID=UPI00100BC6C0|nr:DNA-3-methyladenine glycosylase [Halegenticoccus tardaugens]